MSETIEGLNEQIANLQYKRYKIEVEEFREKQFPRLKEQIGKTFVYRNNSYGDSGSAEDYWDLFRKLVAVELDPGSHYPSLIFQECFIDSDGKATLRLHTDRVLHADRVLPNLVLSGKWKDCPSEEFEGAWIATMAALLTHG